MSATRKVFLIFFLIVCAGPNPAAIDAADDKTVELAKKEGRVNFYTSMGAEESKLVADAEFRLQQHFFP